MNRRRAPRPALTSEQERGFARAAYVLRFLDGGEEAIRDRLARLRDGQTVRAMWPPSLAALRYCPADPADGALVAECETIAAMFRLPDLADNIYGWLLDTRTMSRTDAIGEAPAFLTAFSTVRAVIGDVETRRIERTGIGGRRIMHVDRQPILRLELVTTWEPDREARRDAEKRIVGLLRDQIRAELDRIEDHAESIGYTFRDTRPNAARDIEWLVWRVRDGLSWRQIADRLPETGAENDLALSERAIQMAVTVMVRTLGLKV